MTTASTVVTTAGPELATLQLKIGGMSCSFCTNSIEKALRRHKGVSEVHVSLAHEEALIRFRAAQTTPDAITGTVTVAVSAVNATMPQVASYRGD